MLSESQTSICDVDIHKRNMEGGGATCTDTGAGHCIAGGKLFKLLKEKGTNFKSAQMQMTLADGNTSEVTTLKTQVSIYLEGRSIPTTLIALPVSKGNGTLLGAYFL